MAVGYFMWMKRYFQRVINCNETDTQTKVFWSIREFTALVIINGITKELIGIKININLNCRILNLFFDWDSWIGMKRMRIIYEWINEQMKND